MYITQWVAAVLILIIISDRRFEKVHIGLECILWQYQVEIDHYSFAYFDCVTTLEAL